MSTDWKIIWVGHEMKFKNRIGARSTTWRRQQRFGTREKRHWSSRTLGLSHVVRQTIVGWCFITCIYVVTEMIAQMAWVTEFVRVNKSYGGYMSVLVSGSIEPSKDYLMMEDYLVTIQLATPTRGG